MLINNKPSCKRLLKYSICITGLNIYDLTKIKKKIIILNKVLTKNTEFNVRFFEFVVLELYLGLI